MFSDSSPLGRRADDRAASDDDEDDVAIALDIRDLGAIESKGMMANGYIGEARLAVSDVLKRLGEKSPFKRALYRALRAQDDARKQVDSILEQTRGL